MTATVVKIVFISIQLVTYTSLEIDITRSNYINKVKNL